MVMIARVRDKGALPIKWHIGKSKKLRSALTDITKLLIFHIKVQTMMQLSHRFSCWQFLLNVMTWLVLKLDYCLLPAGVLILNIIRFQVAKGCCWLFFFISLTSIPQVAKCDIMDSVNSELTGDFHDTVEAIGTAKKLLLISLKLYLTSLSNDP